MSLHFRGHVFADHRSACTCCIGDARKVINDPTGTYRLRNKFNGTMALRWRSLRGIVRTMLVDRDLLNLKSGGLLQPVQASVIAGGSKTLAFQRWFDWALNQTVLGGDGSVMRPFLSTAYADGVTFGQTHTSKNVYANVASHRLELLTTLATTELQGIIEAVSQQAVRAVANGLLHNTGAMPIVRAIWTALDKVGVNRTKAMVGLLVVKAFNEGVLDTYEAARVRAVGLVPESVPALRIGDAPRKGVGTRLSRGKAPSRSTIYRIAAAERLLEGLGRVRVRTAGDDSVCDICEGIADDGPYSIDRARSLIPAHPNCRCTFVPVGDARFASDKRIVPPGMARTQRANQDAGVARRVGVGRAQATGYTHDSGTPAVITRRHAS